MNSPNCYDYDYYENGVVSGISGYQHYSWMPTRSIPEALDIINHLSFTTCVDYGCAKGFLVKALRLLGKQAFGEDISDYAIQHCCPDVAQFLSKPSSTRYDLLIAKDVLEHIPEEELPAVLKTLLARADKFFFVIPLGDNDMFRIREYEIDITHVTKKDEEWWLKLFRQHGFVLDSFSYEFGSIKEKWVKGFPHGNGFFVLRSPGSVKNDQAATV